MGKAAEGQYVELIDIKICQTMALFEQSYFGWTIFSQETVCSRVESGTSVGRADGEANAQPQMPGTVE